MCSPQLHTSSQKSGFTNCSHTIFVAHTMQLTKDRPDVVKYIPSDLQAHIRSLPGEIALEVLGALHDVPKGWDKGIKQPAKQLGAIALRAEAHARACASYTTASGTAAAAGGGSHSYGDAAEDDDGWVTAGKGANGGQSSSSNISSSNGHVGASSGSSSSSAVTVAGMISQLERQRPDVWQHLEERHFGVIKPLTQDKQKQVCWQWCGLGWCSHACRCSWAPGCHQAPDTGQAEAGG